MAKLAKIQATLEILVPVDGIDEEDLEFYLIENHCLGTGMAGLVFDKLYSRAEKNNTCWACGITKDQKLLGVEEVAELPEYLREGD